jgi:uncharacterized protein (DUF1501 family)
VKNPTTGCHEYRELTRRGLVTNIGFHALKGLAPSWLPSVVFSDDQKSKGSGAPGRGRLDVSRDVVVSVYLRGGCDGLTMCVPYGEANYYAIRPTIAVPRPDQTTNSRRAIDLNGFFGLPQAMAAFKPFYDDEKFLIVHGTGSTHNTRSHFDAQQYMEAGKQDKALWTGWLGRHIATSSETKTGSLLRAIGLSGTLALTLEGGPKTTAISNLNDANYGGRSETEAARVNWLKTAYETAPAMLRESAENTIKTVELLRSLNFGSYTPGGGAQYNRPMPGGGGTYGGASDFGEACKATAALIKKDVGIEAIHLDFGSWDTHENQRPMEDYGPMFMNMWSLSTNLAALYTDISAAAMGGKVTIVVISEFGRIAMENGAEGTDHGHGNVMFVLGDNVNGGQVMTNWPGLANEQLFESNALAITIDHRDILAEVVKKRLKNDNIAAVFPDYVPTYRNAVRL